MATTTELRADRASRELQGGRADPTRDQRTSGARAPTYSTESKHYREDYGTTMDDVQYAAVEDNTKAWNASVADSTKKLATNRGILDKSATTIANARKTTTSSYTKSKKDAESQYNSGIRSISDSRAKALRANGQGFTNVHIYSNGRFEGTYKLHGSQVSSLSNSIHSYNKANDGDVDWYADGSRGGHKIDVHGYGKEWHTTLRNANSLASKNYHLANARVNNQATTATNTLKTQYNKAKTNLSNQYNKAIGTIQTGERKLGVANAEHKGAVNTFNANKTVRAESLNKIKIDYSSRLSRIKDTIMAMGQPTDNGGEV